MTGEILILGYTPPQYAEELSDGNFISTVVSYEHAKALSESAKTAVRCHVAVDTGMGRIGLREASPMECKEKIKEICALKGLKVEGMFTHFAAADSDGEDDVAYTEEQTDYILEVDRLLREDGTALPCVHFLNSAGGTYYATPKSAVARFGIMLYGLYPNAELPLPVELEPVMDLKAEIAHVKTVPAGVCVSYGRTYETKGDTKIATVTIGYADGYSRRLSSNGEVLIHGRRAPIIGRVCMDQMMVDVTGIDNVVPGDTATLIGSDGNERITADDIASWCGTIGYEIVCGISKRIPRVVIEDGKIINVLEY